MLHWVILTSLAPFAAQQVRGLYPTSGHQRLQSGPRAGRRGSGLRLLRTQWVQPHVVRFCRPSRASSATFTPCHVLIITLFAPHLTARKATRTYNSDALRSTTPCFLCGENCESCRPGVTVIVSPLFSPSESSAAHSVLSLFLGVAAFFAVV